MVEQMRELGVYFSPFPAESSLVGVLALHKNRMYFEYDVTWLKTKLELSPFVLPCKPGVFEHTQREFSPLFGLFDDSLPDGWGLLLMDRFFRQQGLDPASISPLDRLLYLGRNTMGALTYHPPSSQVEPSQTKLNLQELAAHAIKVYDGPEAEVLPLLLRTGGSPGGARPKVLIGYNPMEGSIIAGEGDLGPDFEHWIVKFSAREDGLDAGSIEFAYALMAKAAGIKMTESRLFGGGPQSRYFGVKRFDRKPENQRIHIHTFGNLIQANFRIPACDYGDLFKVTTLLTRNHEDLLQAYRMMIFNILAHNRDDHVKNFSFIMDDRNAQWSLAPAYDLTFSNGPGGEHSTTVDGHGLDIKQQNCVRLAEKFDITPRETKQIITEVEEAVQRWPDFANEANVSAKQTTVITKAHQMVLQSWRD